VPPRIAIGTCGYSYKDWVGPVYPAGTASARMLDVYARRFATVEIDASYYRLPGIATFASMARRTPAGFRFSAKLPGSATHLPDPGTRRVHDDVVLLRRNLQPLVEAGKLACVLAQFPNAFRPADATRDYLGAVRAERRRAGRRVPAPRLADARNAQPASLAADRSRQRRRAAFRDVAARRQRRDRADRVRAFSRPERSELVARHQRDAVRLRVFARGARTVGRADRRHRCRPRGSRVYAYFNNHARGQAVRNAEMLEDMLRGCVPTLVEAPESTKDEEGERLPLPLPLPFDVNLTRG
jgi:uncharacterized protein YecE (DUF72 family)